MNTQTVTREQVVTLAKTMPLEKLAGWYEYGLFIQSRPLLTSVGEAKPEDEAELVAELAAWEAASDEDWLKMERMVEQRF